MDILEILLGLGGLGVGSAGALEQAEQGRADREEWKRRTDDSILHIDQNRDWSQELLARMQSDMLPQYQGLSSLMSSGSSDITGNIASGYEGLTGDYSRMGAGVRGQFGSLEDQMNSLYGNRTSTAMGYVDQMGNQQKSDIQQSISDQRARTQAGMVSSGMGGSTAAAVMDRGVTRDQTDALGRLNESLLVNRLGAYQALSGDELTNRADMGTKATDLALGLGLGGVELDRQRIKDVTDSQRTGLNSTYAANADTIANQERLGTMSLDQVKEWNDRYVGAQLDFGLPPEVIPAALPIGQSATNLFSTLYGKQSQEDPKSGVSLFLISYSCIDARSRVTTRHGVVTISGVMPGDEVLGEDGRYHAVVAKDCGIVPMDDREDLVCITAGPRGSEIVCTPDHVIDCKPADQWRAGDRITIDGAMTTIDDVRMVPYRVTADLLLDGNVPYIANGFVVYSTIGRSGLDLWREHVRLNGRERNGVVVSRANPSGVWAMQSEGCLQVKS